MERSGRADGGSTHGISSASHFPQPTEHLGLSMIGASHSPSSSSSQSAGLPKAKAKAQKLVPKIFGTFLPLKKGPSCVTKYRSTSATWDLVS